MYILYIFKMKTLIIIVILTMASLLESTDSTMVSGNNTTVKPITDFARIPKMVIFELERTLWPSWADNHVSPPFSLTSMGDVVDSRGSLIEYYKDSPKILEYLYTRNISMSIASRTNDPRRVGKLLDLYGWNKYFISKQLSWRKKNIHIQWISRNCNVKYKDMLMFDDANYANTDVKRYNIVTVLVYNGVTMKTLMEGLRKFSDTQLRNKMKVD